MERVVSFKVDRRDQGHAFVLSTRDLQVLTERPASLPRCATCQRLTTGFRKVTVCPLFMGTWFSAPDGGISDSALWKFCQQLPLLVPAQLHHQRWLEESRAGFCRVISWCPRSYDRHVVLPAAFLALEGRASSLSQALVAEALWVS